MRLNFVTILAAIKDSPDGWRRGRSSVARDSVRESLIFDEDSSEGGS